LTLALAAGKLWDVNKREWREAARLAAVEVGELREAARLANLRARGLAEDVSRLKKEVEDMRKHWRPVPIAHPWQPRDPQCIFCDDFRDAPRHREIGEEPGSGLG
jgi:hypothetical protein